jgi:hypothetical protein
MKKQRVHMPKKRFKELSKKIKAGEIKITDELVIEIAKYKFYYMLNNAKNVRVKRRDDYKEVQYKLGAFSKGFDNLKKYRPDLFEKLLQIVRTYLENRMNDDLAPTIHRLKQHYEWEHIDIIPKWKHDEEDSAKMQGVLIMRETDKHYQIIGMDIVKSKKEFAEKIGVNKSVIYNAKPGQVIKINDIILHFQDVIKMPPREWTKDELLEKLERYSYLKNKYKDNPEQYEKFDRMYRIYYNTAVNKGFIDEK